jgi:hypothetical protein
MKAVIVRAAGIALLCGLAVSRGGSAADLSSADVQGGGSRHSRLQSSAMPGRAIACRHTRAFSCSTWLHVGPCSDLLVLNAID